MNRLSVDLIANILTFTQWNEFRKILPHKSNKYDNGCWGGIKHNIEEYGLTAVEGFFEVMANIKMETLITKFELGRLEECLVDELPDDNEESYIENLKIKLYDADISNLPYHLFKVRDKASVELFLKKKLILGNWCDTIHVITFSDLHDSVADYYNFTKKWEDIQKNDGWEREEFMAEYKGYFYNFELYEILTYFK